MSAPFGYDAPHGAAHAHVADPPPAAWIDLDHPQHQQGFYPRSGEMQDQSPGQQVMSPGMHMSPEVRAAAGAPAAMHCVDVPSNTPADVGSRADSPSGYRRHAKHVLRFDGITFGIDVGRVRAMVLGETAGYKKILHGVSARVESGRVMAIIGPSGAGKTTLLDTLARQPHVMNNGSIDLGGTVSVDGVPLDRAYFAAYCAYVPQHDNLWPALTTYENLMYAAKMYGVENPAARCDEALRDLGLQSCRDTKVGSVFIKGLSGGQKRRLSLGCELVNDSCRLFFLDEPTSGLDAAAATEIMRLITRVARERNVIVVTSIHQPSSQVFYSFDQLLLLSGGQTAFYGRAEEALPYFQSLGRTMQRTMNPADFLLEIVNADFADQKGVDVLLQAWKDSNRHMALEEKVPAAGSTPWQSCFSPGRVGRLFCRSALCYSRDPQSYLVRYLMYTIMSGFLGATYYDVGTDQKDITDMIYCILWSVAFFSYMCMVALPAFGMEKQIITKEITNGQFHLAEYTVAAALIHIPLLFLTGLIAATGPYWITNGGLNKEFGRYVQFVIVFSMHLYVVESGGLLVAAVIPNFVLGIIVFCSAISAVYVFNGFYVSIENMPPWFIWIYYLSPFAYTTQALYKIVFSGKTFHGMEECQRLQGLNNSESYPCYGATGDAVLESISSGSLDYRDVNQWYWLLVLVAFAVGFRVMFWVFLRSAVY